MKICTRTQPPAKDNAAPTLTKNYEVEPGKAGAAEDHRTNHLLPVIVRHRDSPPQLRLHSNKQAEANPRTRRRRADYRNQSHVSNIARHHHRCHRSLNATTLTFHWSRLPMSSSKDKAPKREYDTKMPPSSDHKDLGFPPELHRRPEPCGRERQQHSDASSKVNDGHSRRHRESRQKTEIKSPAQTSAAPCLRRRRQAQQMPSPRRCRAQAPIHEVQNQHLMPPMAPDLPILTLPLLHRPPRLTSLPEI
jgi:hypothetical protein